jgi:lysophospholipase L1-like esterase
MAEKSEKEAYLNTLKILARKTPGLNILEFPVQDKEMYRDYLHLNAGGSDLFKQWLPGQLKMLELQ